MKLYIVRHGVAEEAAPGGDDRVRRLTPRGRTKMEEAAAGLRALDVRPEVVLTSPLPRAAETAAILVAGVRGPEPREFPALAPDVATTETLRALRLFARHQSVMIVGHQPNLGQLAALLLGGSTDHPRLEVKKGACLAIELTSFVPGGGASLVWLLPPRILRRLGR